MAAVSINFLIVALLFLSVSANHRAISPHDLQSIYTTILNHQNAANQKNARYAPYPPKLLDVDEVVQILGQKQFLEKGLNLEMISHVYRIIDQKVKYSRAADSMLDSINFDMINLTVYHRYEDVNEIGKKMPLLFANLGPPSTALHKKPPPKFVNNSHILCGSAGSEEQAACVTSVEEMLEFVYQQMGENVKPVSALPGKWQEYAITGRPKVIGHQMTGCHKTDFVRFSVYECHKVADTVARVVPLIGQDGVKVQAVTICHMNTTAWNPHYISFRLLKAKPGILVCHFLATDDIMWLTNSPP